ncbi:VOC family protein [Saccharothrix mutabilis subsp. mutabilis]|uniref:VOC family protein n=2 Tax=Saccharothrix mutabilis TaxID=33921 RepID=A0ABN0THT0_9PSEU
MRGRVSGMTSLHVYLGYRDAGAAIDWLGRAFGFEATMRFPDERGGVAHAELRLGEAALMVFSDHDGYSRAPRRGDTSGQGVYLAVGDAGEVDALFERAVAEGAVPVWEPAGTEWGNHRFRVVDPEGFEWTFGTHRPGQPAEW